MKTKEKFKQIRMTEFGGRSGETQHAHSNKPTNKRTPPPTEEENRESLATLYDGRILTMRGMQELGRAEVTMTGKAVDPKLLEDSMRMACFAIGAGV
jgi:hypothetical protein